jgi:hypothetical protein
MEQEPLETFCQKLCAATTRKAKKNPDGTCLERRLTIQQIKRIAKPMGISLMQLQGHDQWDTEIGGWHRVLVACVGNKYTLWNNHQALLLEDADSPHVSPAWTLYLYHDNRSSS